jgi:hypothetical protein
VSDAETTARALARAIDRFLDDGPPVRDTPHPSAMSFEQQLWSAYDTAAGSGRAMVWAFPRGKPQLFATSPRGLSHGVMTYAFGRRLPRVVQTVIALQVRFPLFRQLVSQRQPRVEPVCGRELWHELADGVRRRNPNLSGEWLHFSSQWDKQRSSFIGLNTSGKPEVFLTIEALDNPSRGPVSAAASYRVPACRHAFRHGDWSVREFEPLPPFHRPARWEPTRIRQVAADVSRALEGRIDRPPDVPAHWRPMHGDLVPWNLREDEDGQLWLLDWEDAGWGPPLADLLRFILAHSSLKRSSPTWIAAQVRSRLAQESEVALAEATTFWLRHHNFLPAQAEPNWPRRKVKDAARGAREFAALRVLARAQPFPEFVA